MTDSSNNSSPSLGKVASFIAKVHTLAHIMERIPVTDVALAGKALDTCAETVEEILRRHPEEAKKAAKRKRWWRKGNNGNVPVTVTKEAPPSTAKGPADASSDPTGE